jgi:hypothetical protein
MRSGRRRRTLPSMSYTMTITRRMFLQAGGGLAAAWILMPVRAGAELLPDPRSGLPAWFDGNRVFGTTRLSRRVWSGTQEFTRAASGFKTLGAAVFTRHVKTGAEDPWPRADLRQMIDEAHSQGLKMIAYYWHMSEATLAAAHPGWVCKRPNGSHIESTRGEWLDITGPYREVVLTRLLDLAELGVDGLNFDSEHLPPEGCWGSPLEAAWMAATGEPRAPRPNDDRYLDYIDFKARRVEATFAYWRQQVRARYPHVVFVISTTTIPALTSRQMTTRLAGIADSSKNEYFLAIRDRFNHFVFRDNPALLVPAAHVRMALGWTVLRESAGGRAPKIWVSGVPNCDHALGAAGSLLAHGCVANMDVFEDSLIGGENQPPGKTPLTALRATFKLGTTVSPHLAGTAAVRWAALHFGERARNKHGDNYLAAWEQVLWPFVGAYQVLAEDGLPVGAVNDQQLEQGELAGYRVLFLPDPGALTAGQQQAVSAFAAGGGIVIKDDPAWEWSSAAGNPGAMAAFRSVLAPYVPAAPVRVVGGPSGRYSVAYANPTRLVVALTNDFSWVQITNAETGSPDVINPPAPLARRVQVTWRGNALQPGSGQAYQAIEAVTSTPLVVRHIGNTYSVELPPFRHLALLVVTRA